MSDYRYQPGKNICYNNNYYTILRKVVSNDEPAYLIKNIVNNNVLNNVLDSECSDCNNVLIINSIWPNFVYNGDNLEASKWIFNNIIRVVNHCKNIEYKSNESKTVYTFSCDEGTWTKNKS